MNCFYLDPIYLLTILLIWSPCSNEEAEANTLEFEEDLEEMSIYICYQQTIL